LRNSETASPQYRDHVGVAAGKPVAAGMSVTAVAATVLAPVR
jgi:hypothetical protein